MKNKKILLLAFLAPLAMFGCHPAGTTSSSQTDPEPASSTPTQTETSSESPSMTDTTPVITAVAINGPTEVDVGASITLTAGVTGDEENEVTWTSGDTSIATVDQTGKVTGIAPGSVKIKATSVKDPTKSAEWTVTVKIKLNTPTAITLTVTGDQVTHDEENDVYVIEVYSEFDLHYALNVENPVEPTGEVTYRLLPDENQLSYEAYVDIDAATGHGTVLMPLEDTVLSVQVAYPLSTENVLYGEAKIRIKDSNQEMIEALLPTLEAAATKEKTEAASAEIKRYRRATNTDYVDGVAQETVSTTDKTIDYTYYTDAVYATVTAPYSNQSGYGLNTAKGYAGIQGEKFYNFEYTSSYGYTTVGDVYAKGAKADYEDMAGLPYDADTNRYGVINNVITMLNGDDYLGLPTFGDDEARRYAVIREVGDTLTISSTYDAAGIGGTTTNAINLTLAYDDADRLSYYRFASAIIEEGVAKDSITEEGNLAYGTKNTGTGEINVSSLLVTYLSANNMQGQKGANGEYDFTDATRYYPVSSYPTQEEYNGTNYNAISMDPTMTYAFELNGSPSPASVLLDDITVTVTPIEYTVLGSEEDGEEDVTPEVPLPVCTVSTLGDGIYTASNAFTTAGNAVKGKSLVTFTTSNNVTYSFIINYTDFGVPTSIRVDLATYPALSIRVGQTTDRFFINATPDTTEYEFELEVKDASTQQPVEDALLLRRPGDEIYGNTGYVIEGLKEGSYQFRIGFADYPDEETLKSSWYTITVEAPLTNEDIETNILAHRFDYEYASSNMGVSLSFDTAAKTVTITQTNYGVVFVDTTGYTLVDGVLTLTGGAAIDGLDGTYLKLGDTVTEGDNSAGRNNPTFGYIQTGVAIDVASDLKSFTLKAATYGYTYFNSVNFKVYQDPWDKFEWNDAYYQYQDSTGTYQYVYVSLAIDDDRAGGTFTFKDYSTREVIGTATFDCVINGTAITITNVTETGTAITADWDATLTGVLSDYGTSGYLSITVKTSSYQTIRFNDYGY